MDNKLNGVLCNKCASCLNSKEKKVSLVTSVNSDKCNAFDKKNLKKYLQKDISLEFARCNQLITKIILNGFIINKKNLSLKHFKFDANTFFFFLDH